MFGSGSVSSETGDYNFDDLYAQVERGQRKLDIAGYECPICAQYTGY